MQSKPNIILNSKVNNNPSLLISQPKANIQPQTTLFSPQRKGQ